MKKYIIFVLLVFLSLETFASYVFVLFNDNKYVSCEKSQIDSLTYTQIDNSSYLSIWKNKEATYLLSKDIYKVVIAEPENKNDICFLSLGGDYIIPVGEEDSEIFISDDWVHIFKDDKSGSTVIKVDPNQTTLDRHTSICSLKANGNVTSYNVLQYGDKSGQYNGHQYIDLGLSVFWAKENCNNIPFFEGDVHIDDIDANLQSWGAGWRIPTIHEWEELASNCSQDGYLTMKSPNGNAIQISDFYLHDATIANGYVGGIESGFLGFWCVDVVDKSYKIISPIDNFEYHDSDLNSHALLRLVRNREMKSSQIYSIPENEIGGWNYGYASNEEILLYTQDKETGDKVLYFNKVDANDSNGLILQFNESDNLIGIGNINDFWHIIETEDSVIFYKVDDDAFVERSFSKSEYKFKLNVKQRTGRELFDLATALSGKNGSYIGLFMSGVDILEDLTNMDLIKLLYDTSWLSITIGISAAAPPVAVTVGITAAAVNLFLALDRENAVRVLFKDCNIHIDDVYCMNGKTFVKTSINHSSSIPNYIYTSNREGCFLRENAISCGILARDVFDRITIDLYDYSSELKFISEKEKTQDAISLTFEMPSVCLTDNFSPIFFRPFLMSSDLDPKTEYNHDSTKRGRIKYGNTVEYKKFNGDILSFNQLYAEHRVSAEGKNYISFDTGVDAYINSLENLLEWGVYVVNQNGLVPYDYYPSHLKNVKTSDSFNINLNVNKEDFDSIDYDNFMAVDTIRLGLYAKLYNETSPQNYSLILQSKPKAYELVYNNKPVIETLEATDIKENEATISMNVENIAFWEVIPFMIYGKDTLSEGIIPTDNIEGVSSYVLTDLESDTQYKYQAIINDNIKGEVKSFKTKVIPIIDVTLSNFEVTNSKYKEKGFVYKGEKYDFRFDTKVTVEITANDFSLVKEWGYIYEDIKGDTARIQLSGTSFTDDRYVYFRNSAHSSVCLYGYYILVGSNDPIYCKKQEFPIYHAMAKAMTGDNSNITKNSAMVSCSFENIPQGSICGVEYSLDGTTNRQNASSKAGIQTITLSGLKSGSKYNYRAFINDDGQMYYGEEKSFTTISESPDLSGTWKCTIYNDNGTVIGTPTLTLSSDKSAKIKDSDPPESVTGSWRINDAGGVSISFTWSTSNGSVGNQEVYSGTANSLSNPSSIEGTVSRARWGLSVHENRYKFRMSK